MLTIERKASLSRTRVRPPVPPASVRKGVRRLLGALNIECSARITDRRDLSGQQVLGMLNSAADGLRFVLGALNT